jgi:hypothetical protein
MEAISSCSFPTVNRWVDSFKDSLLRTQGELEQVPVASRSQKLVNISLGYSMEGWVSCRGVQSLRSGCGHSALSRQGEVCDDSHRELRTLRLRGRRRSQDAYCTDRNRRWSLSLSPCSWRGFSSVQITGGAVFIAGLGQYSILVDHVCSHRN